MGKLTGPFLLSALLLGLGRRLSIWLWRRLDPGASDEDVEAVARFWPLFLVVVAFLAALVPVVAAIRAQARLRSRLWPVPHRLLRRSTRAEP